MHRKYRRPWLILLLVLLGIGSTAAVASTGGEPELQELRQQLQQMQSTLQELSEENRALREHQQDIERRLNALAATAPPATPGAASALPNPAPAQNASAFPAISAPAQAGSLSDS